MKPRWWRRGGWAMPAPRCGHCGWFVNRAGRYDERYVGHGPSCPQTLFPDVATAEQVADQLKAIAVWSYATAHLGMPHQAEWWRMVTWALIQRADQLGVPVPVPDDTTELRRA